MRRVLLRLNRFLDGRPGSSLQRSPDFRPQLLPLLIPAPVKGLILLSLRKQLLTQRRTLLFLRVECRLQLRVVVARLRSAGVDTSHVLACLVLECLDRGREFRDLVLLLPQLPRELPILALQSLPVTVRGTGSAR